MFESDAVNGNSAHFSAMERVAAEHGDPRWFARRYAVDQSRWDGHVPVWFDPEDPAIVV